MTSLLPHVYPRFFRSLYERFSRMVRWHFTLKDGETGNTSEKVSGTAPVIRPTVEQAFCGLSGAPHDPVFAWAVDLQLYAFAPALVVHGAAPVRVAV